MEYEIIERNEYGVLVKNTTTIIDCKCCKYIHKCCGYCYYKSYYLTDKEAAKLETEKQKPLADEIISIQKEKINMLEQTLKQLCESQKELLDLQIENKQLKESMKELEQTIENMKAIAGEKIDFVGTKTSVDLIDDNTTESLKSIPNYFCIEMYICSKCSAEIQEYYNFCPNCGRKIIRK